MIYCPQATGLKKYRDSLWMSPQIEGKESMKLSSELSSFLSRKDNSKFFLKPISLETFHGYKTQILSLAMALIRGGTGTRI